VKELGIRGWLEDQQDRQLTDTEGEGGHTVRVRIQRHSKEGTRKTPLPDPKQHKNALLSNMARNSEPPTLPDQTIHTEP